MKKSRRQYSKGEINRLIDTLPHPLFDHSPELMIVDSVLHGLVEQNLAETAQKFMRYNLPRIIRVHNEIDARVVCVLTLKCFFTGQLFLFESVLSDLGFVRGPTVNCLIQFSVLNAYNVTY